MKKLIFLIVFLVCAVWASAQIMPINAYGYQWKRGYFDTTLRIPVDTISASPEGSIAYKGGIVWKKGSAKWDTLSAGGSTSYSAGSGISIASNVISANYSANIWNANQIQSRAVDLTAPANNQVLTWDSTLAMWKPKAAQGGAFQSLTTTGTSGPATLVAGVLNIPTPAAGGTVTNVSTNTGTGITGGPITGSGTIAADTSSVLSTKANAQRVVNDTAKVLRSLIGTGGGGGFAGTLNTLRRLNDTVTGTITRDTSMVYPGSGGTVIKQWAQYNPLVKTDTAASPFYQWHVGQEFAGQIDDIMLQGWNIAPGGGNYQANRPAIGESWESNFQTNPGGGNVRYVEKHDIYVERWGNQHRLSSWTMNADVPNSIVHYSTTGLEMMYAPDTHLPYYSLTPSGNIITANYIDKTNSGNYFSNNYDFNVDATTTRYSLYSPNIKRNNIFQLYNFNSMFQPANVTFQSNNNSVGTFKVRDSSGTDLTTFDFSKTLTTIANNNTNAYFQFQAGGVNTFESKNYGNIFWKPTFVGVDPGAGSPYSSYILANTQFGHWVRNPTTSGVAIIAVADGGGGGANVGFYTRSNNGGSNVALQIGSTATGSSDYGIYTENAVQSWHKGRFLFGNSHPTGVPGAAIEVFGKAMIDSLDNGSGTDSVVVINNNLLKKVAQSSISGGGGVTTMAAVGSSPNANGATISGSTLTLQPASVSLPGVVTASAQTFGGLKTFGNNVTIGTNTIGINALSLNTARTGNAASVRIMEDDVTGVGAVTVGDYLLPTLRANANNADLVGIKVWPTFSDGSFTGVNHYGLDIVPSDAKVRVANLSGSGTRMVVANATGELSTQTIPSGGSGSVTSVSVVSANGFSGSVATATSTPAITLNTTVTGVLKGDGTGISAAVAGTDYVAPSSNLTNAKTTITSGTSSTIPANTRRVYFDPSSVLSTYTLTLPAAPADGDEVLISFGGTIAAGASVVTTLTISPNSGQSIMQFITPGTAKGGDNILYHYNSTNSKWYREL